MMPEKKETPKPSEMEKREREERDRKMRQSQIEQERGDWEGFGGTQVLPAEPAKKS